MMSLRPVPTRAAAVVYCEANFGETDGKTANGLVRHSERYEIRSVIDSTLAGQDSGVALGEAANGIPILADLASAVKRQEIRPDYLIFGMAPASGMLTSVERAMLLDAMRQGFHLVNGLPKSYKILVHENLPMGLGCSSLLLPDGLIHFHAEMSSSLFPVISKHKESSFNAT